MLKGDLGITLSGWRFLPFTSSFLESQVSAANKRTKSWDQEEKAEDEETLLFVTGKAAEQENQRWLKEKKRTARI